jgi:hypothetical protein
MSTEKPKTPTESETPTPGWGGLDAGAAGAALLISDTA